MISKHISEKEGSKSVTAIRLGIDNTPDAEAMANMKLIAEKVFEPLREYVGGPIKINSFFRSPALNEAIGGASDKSGRQTSQHCKGQAIDIDDIYGHKTNKEMFDWIRDTLSFDTLIWEFGSDNPDWVHVSYVSEDKNRNRVLKAVRDNGKTKYITI